jgi:Ca2+-binding EF-hand superfamily protein
MRTIVIVATASVILSSPLAAAQAQQQPKPMARADYIKNVDARFNSADANHDGKITKEEIAASLDRDIAQTRQKLAATLQSKFKQLDTNHDGQLSFQEFLAAAPAIRPTETAEQVLRRLDTNHDGKVSPQEFRASEVAKFDKADANHDGIVTPEEAAGHH